MTYRPLIILLTFLTFVLTASAQSAKVQMVTDYVNTLNEMFDTKEYKTATDKLEPLFTYKVTNAKTGEINTVSCRFNDFISDEIIIEKQLQGAESVTPETYLMHLWKKCRENTMQIQILNIIEESDGKRVTAKLFFSKPYNTAIHEKFVFFDDEHFALISQDRDIDKLHNLIDRISGNQAPLVTHENSATPATPFTITSCTANANDGFSIDISYDCSVAGNYPLRIDFDLTQRFTNGKYVDETLKKLSLVRNISVHTGTGKTTLKFTDSLPKEWSLSYRFFYNDNELCKGSFDFSKQQY